MGDFGRGRWPDPSEYRLDESPQPDAAQEARMISGSRGVATGGRGQQGPGPPLFKSGGLAPHQK